MRTWMLGVVVLFALAFALPAHAQGCAIMTNLGMAPDYDCDGVIDDFDNCPGMPNAQQYDMNRNGIGDSCDLLIEEVMVNPDNHLRQGEIAHLTVRLVNNYDMPLERITVTVSNSELGIDAQQTLEFIPQGEAAALDFWVLVPKCAKVKTYPVSISVKTSNGVETQSESIIVEKGNVCGTPASALDTTVVQTTAQIDIDAGGAALLPITIHNLGDKQATYDLSIADLGPFATWRIDPAPRMSLPAGHSDTVYLYLQTEDGIPAGRRTVEFTVTSGTQKTTVPIEVYVREYREQKAPAGLLLMQIIFIIILLALIIAAIIIAVRSGRRRRPDKDHDKYVHISDLKGDDDNATPAKATKVTKITKTTKTVSVENADDKMETYY